jgi:hypothetical protein
MQIFQAGALYFAVVFAAGFGLGTVRTLLIVPRFGVRTAELMEAPIMFVVTILAASWVARRLRLPRAPLGRLGVGLVGLVLLLLAELAVALWLRRLTVAEYLASRDPVAGAVYLMLLAIFAIMPLLVARR